MNEVKMQIDAALKKIPVGEHKTFETAKDFYDYLKAQGITATFDEVKAVLIDMHNMQKQELDIENFEEIIGGAQIEINNTVKNNKKPVNIGQVTIIGM